MFEVLRRGVSGASFRGDKARSGGGGLECTVGIEFGGGKCCTVSRRTCTVAVISREKFKSTNPYADFMLPENTVQRPCSRPYSRNHRVCWGYRRSREQSRSCEN